MSVRKKLAIGAGAVAALLAVAVIAVVVLVRPERIKATALARARAATGYAIEAGPASIHFTFTGAGVRIEALSLAAPDSSQSLTVDAVDVYVKLLPLLRKHVELSRVDLHHPVYRLRETPAVAGSTPSAPGAEAPAGPPALAFLAVESWHVEDGVYVQSARAGTLTVDGVDLAGGLQFRPGRGGTGDARGSFGGGAWTGTGGPLALPAGTASATFRMPASLDSLVLPAITVESGPVRVDLAGAYARTGNAWSGTLDGAVRPFEIAELLAALPPADRARLSAVELSGRLELPDLELVRTADGENRTAGRITANGIAARLPGAALGLTGGTARVDFAPGVVELSQARATLGQEPVRLGGKITGEPPQRFEASVTTRVDGTVLSALLPPSAGLSLDRGALAVDLSAEGRLPVDRAHPPAVTGSVRIEDLAGAVRGLPLRGGRGTVRVKGTAVTVEDLGARLGASDFTLSGSLEDLLHPDLHFTAHSDTLDLDQLGALARPPGGAASDSGKAAGPPPLVGVPGEGTVRVGRVRYHRTTLTGVSAHVKAGREGVSVTGLEAGLAGGTLSGSLDLAPAPGSAGWSYHGKLNLAGVEAGPVLAAWVPGGKRLEGRTGGSITVAGKAGGAADPLAALDLAARLTLQDGAFANLPGLMALGRALNVKEAAGARWPFRDLTGRIAVRDGRVTVDTVRVTQEGLGWTLAGTAALTGALDLGGTLRLDPARIALPAEVKLLAPYVADADGRIPVDFRLGGTFTDPRVALDWQALVGRATEKAKREESEKLQRQLEKTVKDPDTLKKLKDLLKGKGGG